MPDEERKIRAIHSRQLHQWCLDAGIYQPGDMVTRVAIVIDCQREARVYVERLGDNRVLTVEPFRVAWIDRETGVAYEDQPDESIDPLGGQQSSSGCGGDAGADEAPEQP